MLSRRDLSRAAGVPRPQTACGACTLARWCPSYGTGPTDREAVKLLRPRWLSCRAGHGVAVTLAPA